MKAKRKEKVNKAVNLFMAIVLIFTIALFVVTFAQNIVCRASEMYAYYFNDSRVIDKIHTSYSNNELADKITEYLNSFDDEPFVLSEYTGYDNESIFTEEDGENMLLYKRALNRTAVVCFTSFMISLAILIYLVRNNKKKLARDMSKAGEIAAIGLIALTAKLALTESGQMYMHAKAGLAVLGEGSPLATILNSDFVHMAGIAFTGVAFAVWLAVGYFTHLATRQESIFKR